MYPDFKNYDEYNHYILSYASNQDVAELEKKIDDVQKDQEGQSDIPLVDGKIPASYLPSNMVTTGEDGKITVDKLPESVVTVGDDGTIPSSKLPSYVDDVVDVDTLPETGEAGKIYITVENKQYRWTGSQFAEITSGGVVIGDVTGTAYDGGKGVALESRVTTVENKFAEYPTKEEMDTAVNAVDEKVTTLEGKAVTYSDFSYVPGGESDPVARKTIQLANYDSISGMNTTGDDAANLIMMSKWDKVDIGSSRYPVNLNGSEFTLNDEKHIATTDQIPDVSNFATKDEIPSLDGYATTQNVSDSIAAEASARDKAIETATSDLVHNTLTVAGKSLTGNVTLASADLTDGDELARKDEILNTVVDESRNETLAQSLTARTYLPFARNSDLENQTEAQIFALFSNNVTDRASLREYVQSNMAYISYNLDSRGEHQYYKSTILMASVPDDGDITVIAIAADIYNSDKLSKFTYTITLNGDASSVHIEKKALEA